MPYEVGQKALIDQGSGYVSVTIAKVNEDVPAYKNRVPITATQYVVRDAYGDTDELFEDEVFLAEPTSMTTYQVGQAVRTHDMRGTIGWVTIRGVKENVELADGTTTTEYVVADARGNMDDRREDEIFA